MKESKNSFIDETIVQDNLLSRVATILDKILVYISIVLAALLTLNLIAAVFFRYVLSKPIFWADELSLILFAWITFLGGCLAVKRSEMAAVTILFDRLSEKLKVVFYSLIQLSIIFFVVFVTYYSFIWIKSPSVQNMISATLRINMWWLYLIIPIAMLCILVFSVSNLYSYLLQYRFSHKGDANQ